MQNVADLGVFYRCDEYALLEHKICLRAYFVDTWEVLV